MKTAVFVIAASALVGQAVAGIAPIASSVDDFNTDPSQGFNGWSYGYFNITQPAGFIPLPTFSSGQWTINGSSWTTINNTSAHPHLPGFGRNNPEEHHAARRWTSTVDGSINVSGDILRPSGFGDGSFVSILLNGSEEFALLLTPTLGTDYDLNFDVTVGDTIDFVVAPLGGIQSDGVLFSAIIVPTPGTVTLCGVGMLASLRRRRD